MLHNICYLAHASYYIVEQTFISDLSSDKLWISSDKKQGENTISSESPSKTTSNSVKEI